MLPRPAPGTTARKTPPLNTSPTRTHPHLFVVLIDDQGYADMGYNNDLDVLSKCTPFMDQLAGDGIKLTQYYTQQL